MLKLFDFNCFTWIVSLYFMLIFPFLPLPSLNIGSGEREVIELPLSSIQIQKVLTFLRRHQSEMDHLPTSISDELPYLQKEMNFMKPDDSKTDLDLEERLNVSQQDRELFGNFFETTEVIKVFVVIVVVVLNCPLVI